MFEKNFHIQNNNLLLNDLLIIMRIVGVMLLLFRNIMIRNYKDFKINIDLLFAITEIVDRLISCDVIYEMENSFNHLFIDTIFDLKTQKKLKRQFKRN